MCFIENIYNFKYSEKIQKLQKLKVVAASPETAEGFDQRTAKKRTKSAELRSYKN